MIIFIVLIVLFLIVYFICKAIWGERIEVDYSREKIFGWYNGDILCSEHFSRDSPAADIILKKDTVRKKLKQEIIKYKLVNKY